MSRPTGATDAGATVERMCRNIHVLHNFEPAAHEIAHITQHLLEDLVAFGQPKNREIEAAKAKERSVKRFATA